MGAALVEGHMLDGAVLIAQTLDDLYVLYIYDIDNEFAAEVSLKPEIDLKVLLLAGHSNPILIWAQRDVSDRQCASPQNVSAITRSYSVLVDGSIFGACDEKAILQPC